MKIDKENLEKALSKKSNEKQPKISKDEEIGFHKGALNTLVNERNELFTMIQNVEAIMQMHMKRLEELGVKIEKK
ncbi:MAG TPA: hypothetical protein ENG87_04095 [Candidatus Pacearchaeota archaeon]|nr:hypothetical protein BMS3Abin17_00790 [archaeon BMS3Abin17]HDK42535.1 hypothetical protein [Candidatus Pacearchaeota archaeon]HDZ60550.1 hypothetical protein [Candidatus Pacearchaeota archaeon]